MRAKAIFSLLIICLNTFRINAQSPGYMGKHVSLGYSANMFISLIGPVEKHYGSGFNYTHCFNIDYTISNRTNFCLSYQRFKTGVNSTHIFTEGQTDAYGRTMNMQYFYDSDVPMLIKCNGFGVGFKFFNKDAFAPIGKYKKVEFVLLLPKLSYGDKSFTIRDASVSQTSKGIIGAGDYLFKTFALIYTIGRQRILFDRIVLDYGIQLGWMPAGVFATLEGESDYSRLNTAEIVFRQDTNKRLFRFEVFNFHLGLGLLAF